MEESACVGDNFGMTDPIEEWSAKEARRIARVARCMPETMREQYIAQRMVEAIVEFVALRTT